MSNRRAASANRTGPALRATLVALVVVDALLLAHLVRTVGDGGVQPVLFALVLFLLALETTVVTALRATGRPVGRGRRAPGRRAAGRSSGKRARSHRESRVPAVG
jgi:hypothetical protein